MSFLDRFKRKPSKDKGPAIEAKGQPEVVPARLLDPAETAHSRGPGVLGFQPVEPLPRGTATPRGPKHELHLELGDFLPRIAPTLLHDGPHADSTKLTFDVADLAERIARGQTGMRLTEIYRRVPEIFREELPESDETEIRFPWQKVLRMLANARTVPAAADSTGLTAAAADALAETFRNRRTGRNPIPESGATTSPDEHEGESGADSEDSGTGATSNSPLPDDAKLTREELLRTRDAMRAQFRRAKTEHDRKMALFAQEREQANEERQRFVAEMLRLKKEADDKDSQIRFEKEVGAKTADTLAKVREANAALARQLAEAPGGARNSSESAPNENFRVAEELRQRITSLETNQRDTALELGREREAKSKLEHRLTALNRQAAEGAAKIEEALAAARRDFETTQRKREEDATRALRQAREEFAEANAGRERLAAELAETQARIASESATAISAETSEAWEGRAVAQLEADVERYRQRIQSLLAERDALAQEKSAIAQQLTTEAGRREEIAGAHAGLTSALESTRADSEATTAALRADLRKAGDDCAAARKENERLASEQSTAAAALAQLRAETQQLRDALAAAQNEAGQVRAELAAQAAAATAERAAFAGELAAARQARETEQAAHSALRADHEKVESERAALAERLAEAEAAHARAFASLTEESANLGAKARTLHAELTGLKAEHEKATETIRANAAAHESAANALTARAEKLLQEKTALETKIADTERELSKLHARVQQSDVTVAGAEVAIRHHDEAIAKLREQHGQTLAARAAEYEAALAAAKAGHEEVISALQARHEEDLRGSTESGSRFAGEIARLTEAAATAQRESAAAAQSLSAANSEADRKFSAFQRERDALLAERRLVAAELEAAKDALKAQAVVFARDLKRARQQRETTAPQPEHFDATPVGESDDEPCDLARRPRRDRKERGAVIDVAHASELSAPAAESGQLKIQRVRPVQIRPPQVKTR
jgi:chromosome segregation ATPase